MSSLLHRQHHRSGTILIIVAGVSALMASLALAFLARMRTDVEESNFIVAHAQAKILLAAGCAYVQEASRLGYDQFGMGGATSGIHNEAFGWIDVRDGSIGPKGVDEQPVLEWSQSISEAYGNGRQRPRWPAIGGVVRCPLHRLEVPPFAIQLTAAYNPMQTADPSETSTYCWPLLSRPDPQPLLSNSYVHQASIQSSGVDATQYDAFATGRPTPVSSTVGRAWFRVMRDGPSTFLITCGVGGTEGYRDWAEVEHIGGQAERERFLGDPNFFGDLQRSELRMWYRIEWSAATMDQTYNFLEHDEARGHLHYLVHPANASHNYIGTPRSQSFHRNPVGTIRWVQRLRTEPTHW
jgi:hypothetical protein